MNEDQLKLYDELVSKCPRFDRKGKTMPYTSANGYMFSLLNKAGELGFRYSKEVQEKYMEEWDSTYYKSYGAKMKGYVLIPDSMLDDLNKLAELINESYDYVMSLEPKYIHVQTHAEVQGQREKTWHAKKQPIQNLPKNYLADSLVA